MGNSSSSSKTVKQDYFDRINNTRIRCSKENSNNPQNYSICLDKKNFDSLEVSRKINIRHNKKYFNWKKYLLVHLRKEAEKGMNWALHLHFAITRIEFFNENTFQSNFFNQEFKLLTEPKCLLEYEHHNLSVKNQSRSQYSNSVYSFKNNFMGSFLTKSFDSSGSTEVGANYKHHKNKIKQYVKYFQLHIFNQQHPINIIVNEFAKLFSEEVQMIIQDIRTHDLNEQEKRERLNLVIKQLQRFIVEMQVVLKLFYSNTISFQYFLEEKDEFINLITSLMFSTNMYEKIYSLYEIVLRDKIDKMRNQLKKFRHIRPEDLDVKTQFCLNDSTRSFQASLKMTPQCQIKGNQNNDDNHLNDSDGDELITTSKKVINIQTKSNTATKHISNDHINQNNNNNSDNYQPKSLQNNLFKNVGIENISSELSIVSESQKINAFKKKQKTSNQNQPNDKEPPPFQNAIKLLKTLASIRVPLEKMMIVATVSIEITEAVNSYWKNMENDIKKPSLLSIDSDQLMTIFIYIIIKSEIAELVIHSELVRNFTTPMTRTTMMGFYFTTLEGSIDYIMEMKDKTESKSCGIIMEEDNKYTNSPSN